jgi:hypothetical protein
MAGNTKCCPVSEEERGSALERPLANETAHIQKKRRIKVRPPKEAKK